MATIVQFEFIQSTLTVEEGYKKGNLELAVRTGNFEGEPVFPAITISDQTVISAPSSVYLYATHYQSSKVTVPITGISQGTATVTATLEHSGTTLTATATITVVEPTQVIVSEPSLKNIADTLRDKLGVSDTYTPAQMSGAIEDVGKYAIRREVSISNNKKTLGVGKLDSYTVPDDIDIIGSYALAGAFQSPGWATLVDLNNVTEIGSYGLDHFSYRATNSGLTRSLKADNLVTAGDYAFNYAFHYYDGDTISFPELTTVGNRTFDHAFQYIERSNTQWTPCAVSFPKLTSCGTYAFNYGFAAAGFTGPNYGIQSADFSGLTTAGNYAFYNAFYSNRNLTSIDFSSLQTVGNSAFYEGFSGCSSLASLDFPELTTAGDSAFYRGLNIGSNAASATVSFPKLSTIGKNCFNSALMWGGVKSVSFPEIVTAPEGAFGSLFSWSSSSGRYDVQKASFPKLTTVDKNTFSSAFAYQTVITTVGGTGCDVELPELTTCGDGSFGNMFYNCTSLTTLSFPKLKESTGTSHMFQYMCDGCSSLTSATFPALDTLTQAYTFRYAFRNCTSLASISFPALTTSSFGSSRSQFSDMLGGVTGCTLHFPAAVQANIQAMTGYPNFGGTNTTVSFDL